MNGDERKMKDPLVSIVVPVYNTEEFVGKTIESILKQSFSKFEVILVDDGSTDNSRSVCCMYSEKDSRVRYVYIEHGGVSAARNRGIEEALGEFILFCDSDDMWDVDLLKLVVAAFEDKECGMVRFGLQSENEEFCPSENLISAVYSQKELLEKYFIDSTISDNMSSCVLGGYRKENIDKFGIRFDNKLALGEDGKFVMEYSLCINKIALLENRLYHYYPVFENRVNTTARKRKILYNAYELWELLFDLFFKAYDGVLEQKLKKSIYASFMDGLIGKLVRYGAYSPYTKVRDNVKLVRKFICKEDVQAAIKCYRPTRKSDSRWIPFCIRYKWAYALWFVLLSKRQKYFALYGKKPYGMSIYAKDPEVCYQK